MIKLPSQTWSAYAKDLSSMRLKLLQPMLHQPRLHQPRLERDKGVYANDWANLAVPPPNCKSLQAYVFGVLVVSYYDSCF